MEKTEIVTAFWQDVAAQDAAALKKYFEDGAQIWWHCSNECFSVEEFIRANCEYPGNWKGQVERIVVTGDLAVTAARVWLADETASFHAASFFQFCGDQIHTLDEYWGDDGPAPLWRLEKQIGRAIR